MRGSGFVQSLRTHTGKVVPLDRVNVDTDAIIPKQFLKRIERTGFGQFLFYEWRFDVQGNPIDTFSLNAPQYKGASILLTRANFGCGSSREHAPWAIADYGFRVIIAPSFADIFYNNCFKNGILPLILSEERVDALFDRTGSGVPYTLTVDVASCRVYDDAGFSETFVIDAHRKHALLEGIDDIEQTLLLEEHIAAYERQCAPRSYFG
jgi:3-isopropylmalate/(R)-2-methylmalate dehydratase small subunit